MLIKEDIRLDNIPRRKLIEVEKVYIDLLLEKIRLERSKYSQLANKTYGLSLVFAVLGTGAFFFNYITARTFQTTLIISAAFLIVSVVFMLINFHKQDTLIQELLNYIRK